MEEDITAKQTFLRTKIIDCGYDPAEFVLFLDECLKIGDDLTKCTMQ